MCIVGTLNKTVAYYCVVVALELVIEDHHQPNFGETRDIQHMCFGNAKKTLVIMIL